MKKLLLFLITLTFLAVSCSGSKKAENDADLLPDKDAADVDVIDEDADLDDEVNVDEDETDDEEPDEDTDYDEDNPCNPNPCEETEHSDGACTIFYGDYYCGCFERYSWDSESKKCVLDEKPDETPDTDMDETPDSDGN